MKLRKIARQEWIEALRSGDYAQGKQYLASSEGSGTCFCCLGVAAILAGASEEILLNNRKDTDQSLSGWHTGGPEYWPLRRLLTDLDIYTKEERILTHMNDSGQSFSEIADYLERLP